MKLSLLNKDIILMIENSDGDLKLHYADGHNEILIGDDFQEYIVRQNSGYKQPIYIQKQWLYPIMNYRDERCIWIHLEYLDEYCYAFVPLLKHRNLSDKVRKMYLKYIEKKLIEKGLV